MTIQFPEFRCYITRTQVLSKCKLYNTVTFQKTFATGNGKYHTRIGWEQSDVTLNPSCPWPCEGL